MFKQPSSPDRAAGKALFLVAALLFQSFSAPTRGVVFAKAADAEMKTAPSASGNAEAKLPAAIPQPAPVPQDRNAPQAAAIVATLTDNVTAATKIAPGANINYTATITNNGAVSPADDATNLNFSAPLDANTTLVGGSIHASPIAFNETYNWVGNTQLDTAARALPAVTANDVAVNAPAGTDTFTVTAIAGGATSLGGTVTLASPSGAFTYTPPVGRPNIVDGASVNDTFTYTITNNADAGLTSTGTVTITLTGRVWYLQAGAAGDGRSNTPSSSPAAMSTAADKSTDFFYIFSGGGSLNGPFSVDAGQQLLGQGVNLVVSAITLFTATSNPTTTNTAGNCVALAGAPGNNTLSGFNIGNCTGGTAITGANVGTLNVSTLSINTNGGALDLTGVGAPTVSVVLGGTTSTGGAKNVNLVGLNGTVTLASGALSGATGNGLDVNGGTAAVTYSGTISNSGAKQVNVANKTGGSVALSGAVGGTGTGINLTTNTGATISFTGGIAVSSGTNAAFTATGGGTVTATQNNTTIVNTLTTSSGTALNVANTTIGAAGLTFRSISSNGASSGIVLNTTGASGGLTVTGNSGGLCGGQVTVNAVGTPATVTAPNSADCTGGTIQNTTSHGVSLTNASNVSLTRMFIHDNSGNAVSISGSSGVSLASSFIQDTTDSGIKGVLSASNFSFTNGTIDNSGTSLAAQTSNIAFNNDAGGNETNLTGTFTVTGSSLTTAFYHGMSVKNFAGTLSDVNVSSNSIVSTTSTATSKGDGVQFNTFGGAAAAGSITKATITQNTITNFPSDSGVLFQCNQVTSEAAPATTCGSGGANLVNITNNTIAGQSPANKIGTQGILFSVNGRGTGNFNVSGNNVQNITGTGLSNSAFGDAVVTSVIDGNTLILNNTVGAVGLGGGTSNTVGFTSTPSMTVTVTNNIISQVDGNSIGFFARDLATGQMNIAIKNNTVSAPLGGVRPGIRVDAGNSSGDNDVCLDISGNHGPGVTGVGGSTGSPGIGLRKQGTSATVNAFGIEGMGATSTPGVEAFVDALNTSDPGPPFGDGNGVLLISATSGFSNCGSAPKPNPGDDGAMNMAPVSNTPMNLTARSASPVIFDVIAEPQALSDLHNILTGSRNNFVPSPAIRQTVSEPIRATEKPVVASIAPASTGYRGTLGNVMHHAINTMGGVANRLDSIITPTAYAQKESVPNAPNSGEVVSLNTIATFPAGGKSITIKYSATVNAPPLARQVSTQGTVTANGGINVLTDDPEPAGAANPTVTLVDTLMTWNGVTDINWNTITNWTQPAGGTQYAPGVSNPAINDVVIPNVGNQPNINATDIGVFSLNIANGRTLTITSPLVLTIGAPAPGVGGDLTVDGIISGGFLNLGTGTHVIFNAGGTGSIVGGNQATVLSGSAVTLNNNLQMGSLTVNAGGSMNITNRTLSLARAGAALNIPGGATFTTTGSTVVLNGGVGQTIAGIAYNNLTINNSIGAHVTGVTLQGNASVAGVLTLTSSDLATTGAFTLTMPVAATSGPASGASDVVGNVKRTGFVSGGSALSFGNPFNTIRINSGTAPADITMVIAKNAPATYAGAVLRSYTITPSGANGPATLRLHYRQTELNGNLETPTTDFNFRKGPSWTAVIPTSRNTGVAEDNWLENNAVPSFSEWTMSNLAPTASLGVVTGRIVDNNGAPVEGAVVRLTGGQTRKLITDKDGNYRFENVETNGLYTVTPSRANFSFNPFNRSFTMVGNQTEAAFTGTMLGDNLNPLDTPEYFVRQQYVDILNREPDEAGFNYWSNHILACGEDVDCVRAERTGVASAFFIEQEFRQSGAFIYNVYSGALGRRPVYAEYSADRRNVVGGATLEAQKQAFAEAFVARAEFVNRYQNHTTAESFVDALLANVQQASGADLSSQRDSLIGRYNTGASQAESRTLVLRDVTDSAAVRDANYNKAFVLVEYFGYLHRGPDEQGYEFWLNVLNTGDPGNYRGMVCSFITSAEYQNRFSVVVSHSNSECSGQ